MPLTIYHNPDCGTSRNVLKMIETFSDSYEIIEYLKVGWSRDGLSKLLKDAKLTPRKALRLSKSPAKELGLDDPSVSDDAIFEAMLEHPILVNRPIVQTASQTVLCRPSERAFEVLSVPKGTTFIKEDGEKITHE